MLRSTLCRGWGSTRCCRCRCVRSVRGRRVATILLVDASRFAVVGGGPCGIVGAPVRQRGAPIGIVAGGWRAGAVPGSLLVGRSRRIERGTTSRPCGGRIEHGRGGASAIGVGKAKCGAASRRPSNHDGCNVAVGVASLRLCPMSRVGWCASWWRRLVSEPAVRRLHSPTKPPMLLAALAGILRAAFGTVARWSRLRSPASPSGDLLCGVPRIVSVCGTGCSALSRRRGKDVEFAWGGPSSVWCSRSS